MLLEKEIRKIVKHYVEKYGTSDPFALARALDIEVQYGNLGSTCGLYMYLKRHKCIFLNENLEGSEKRLVMAHELGHAIMHPRENCYYLRNNTMLSTSKIEIEANLFALEFLLSSQGFTEGKSYTHEQWLRLLNYYSYGVKHGVSFFLQAAAHRLT